MSDLMGRRKAGRKGTGRPGRGRRPGRRRGFIILFGWRGITSNDSRPPVTATCPNCRQTAQMMGRRQRTWFTLFFIPLFPVSGATQYVQCSACGAAFEGDLDQFQRGIAAMDASRYQQGIAMYNALRGAPGDSALLNQLMDYYGMMGEFNEAISAARHFPEALENSTQCLTTLGKIQLSASLPQEAVGSFGRALAKSPGFGDAHYFQAMAYLALTPPDTQRAIAAARAAQGAGHPDAPALLRRAEEMSRREQRNVSNRGAANEHAER